MDLHARDDNSGAAVDWWFIYKLPHGIGPNKDRLTDGNEFLYYDATPKVPLQLSRSKLGIDRSGALYHTFEQLFRRAPKSSAGWIFYNNQYPETMTIRPGESPEKIDLDKRQADLIATWPDKSDWPPTVKPAMHTRGRASDLGKPNDNGKNGHCKGVLAFDLDSDTAFWLSHSTPRIPALHMPAAERFFYPSYADTYAQTFICITLENVATACRIAEVMCTQHEPQVYGCRLPQRVTEKSNWGALWSLAQGIAPPAYGDAYTAKHGRRKPADITFKSRGGKEFRLLAKSGAWDDDFWINLVEPALDTSLRVETWRRLTKTAVLPSEKDAAGKEEFGDHDFVTYYHGREYHHEFLAKCGKKVIDEVTNIDLGLLTDSEGNTLSGYEWAYTKDHAKWAVSEREDEVGIATMGAKSGGVVAAQETGKQTDWVCVADLNRMTSQERRGGGGICFHEPLLWHNLTMIERIKGKIT